jgi:hypothetical protein
MLAAMINFSESRADNLIYDYTKTFIPLYTEKGELRIVIRHFEKNHVMTVLSVNPYNLSTEIRPLSTLYYRDLHRDTPKTLAYAAWKNIENTPYLRALNQFTRYPGFLENAGLTHAISTRLEGYFLTIDMCPSVKPFERGLFQQLAGLSHMTHQAIPIAISISGLWMIEHPKEWAWLRLLQQENTLAITWVNHSFSHLYFNDLPISHNFLLFQRTDLNDEIVSTERALIEQGLVPSVFFRAPGLVADKHVLSTLKTYGLIPLGADAWLAKKQKPTPGSVILVHGNGLEPLGVRLLRPWLTPNFNLPNLALKQKTKDAVKFLPLNKAIAK